MPLLFCPNCSNLLVVKSTEPDDQYPEGRNAFTCRTCPYQYLIEDMFFEVRKVTPKKVEDIISEEDIWKSANQTTVQCANNDCDSNRAYFVQRQIRSADEPMTTNFKCMECSKEWREN